MRIKKVKTTDEASPKQTVEKIKYWDAIEVKEIAIKLISENNFTFPTNVPICYVFIDTAKYWGKASLVSPLTNFMSGYNFILTINHAQWLLLNEQQREALVFHELCHFGYDAEKDKYYIVDHDLEEFSRVVSKYGLWRESVKIMADSIQKRLSVG